MKKSSSRIKYDFFVPAMYVVLFSSMLVKGAYSVFWLLILNLFFTAVLIISKKPVVLNTVFYLLSGLFVSALFSAVFLADNAYLAMCELPKYSLLPLAYAVFVSHTELKSSELVFYRSIFFMCWGGLLATGGLPLFDNMVIHSSGRLQSFLQYANTAALLLGVGVLLAIQYFIDTHKKVHLVSAAILSAAFLLTKSRISFGVFLIVLILYLSERLKKRGRIILIGGVVLLSAALVLFGQRIVRISIFEPTLIERFITYQDTLNAFTQAPLGIGLGDWQIQQRFLQSAPYFVKYIHSVFFKLLADCGIVGVMCFAFAALVPLLQSIKRRSVHFYILLLILGSAALDVHLEFGVVIVLFAFTLAKLPSPPHITVQPTRLRFAMLAPAAVFAVFLLSESFFFAGKLGSSKAYSAALALNPSNYRIYFEKAQLEPLASDSLEHLEKAVAINPYDPVLIRELTLGYTRGGDYGAALSYAERAFELGKYDTDMQELYLDTLNAAHEAGYLDNGEYGQKSEAALRHIAENNAKINPMYKYIDSELRY